MKKFRKGVLVFAALFFLEVAESIVAWDRIAYASSSGQARNLIMISINNIGTEHMGLYGYTRKTTPYIETWASEALVFEDVFSPVSWTLPALTSVFTSLFPYTHGVLGRLQNNVLDPNIKTLAEILKANNYETAAFTGGADASNNFGHMRGFKDTKDNPAFSGFDVTVGQSQKWLAKHSKQKFFLFIQGYDAHPPFMPPKDFAGVFSNRKGKNITVDPTLVLRGFKKSSNQYVASYKYLPKSSSSSLAKNTSQSQNILIGRSIILTQDDVDYLRDLYDEEILSVDYLIGRFLNSLDNDILRNTIIVIFSEHGEMFAKHGRFGRAGQVRGTLYDEVVHVPLIMRIPGRQGKRIKGLAGLTDIMPTLLELLAVSDSAPVQGKSLVPLIDHNEPVNDFVYAGSRYNLNHKVPEYKPESVNESIRTNEWKLIREVIFSESGVDEKHSEETFELYDLKNDPDELHDCIDRWPIKATELKGRLNVWAQRCINGLSSSAKTSKIPDKLLEDVRQHGYW